MATHKITKIALLSSAAIVLGYVESLFPLHITIPGVKLGISNVVIICALYGIDIASAWYIMFIKVLSSCVLFSGMNTFLYSIAGGVASVSFMVLLKNTRKFGIMGVSTIGAVAHNMAQICVACIVLDSKYVWYYTPFLLVAGVIVGMIIGSVGRMMVNRGL